MQTALTNQHYDPPSPTSLITYAILLCLYLIHMDDGHGPSETTVYRGPTATKKEGWKTSEQTAFFAQSLMAPINASNIDYTSLILV